MLRRVGVLTSGGDSPGMNASIRAVTRTALYHGLEVIGIRRGYEGLLDGDFVPMTRSTVGGILMHGGTILRTASGSFHGALELHKRGVQVVGVPGTIDNDMAGTDCTIGFDTACNTALECISKLRDTASSHDRMFIVEVMGRHAGFLALETAVACGAEFVLVPEIPADIDAIIKKIHYAKEHGKTHSIIVLAEGVMPAHELADKLKGRCDYDPRIVVLGHIQRGGAPSSFDAVLASRLGYAAVECLLAGQSGVMVGRVKGEILASPLQRAWEERRPLDQDMLRIMDTLSI